MDYQNAEFYKLNKNTPDLVYNFADELITYRKETDEHGNLQIVEYRKKDGRKGKKATTRRVVPSHEMSIVDFDAWKTRLTEEALKYRRHDDLTTRENVSIENLLETDLVCEESVEDEYLRMEEERQALPKTMKEALEILDVLTPAQKHRYLQVKMYHKVGDGVEIVEEEAKIIREIFEKYYAGESPQNICNSLNERNVPTPSNKGKWVHATIQKILRNEKYKGDVITQKTYCSDLLTHKRVKNTGQLPQHYITDHHVAIVDRDLFDRVQAEYSRRTAKKKITCNTEEAPKKSKYSSKYALTELLVCGDCGCPYRRCTWVRRGEKRIVWRCTTRIEYGKSKCGEAPTLDEDVLHKAILKALSSLVENKDEVKDELKVALGNVLIDTGTDICIAHLEAQLKEQENDMMRVVRICAERGNQKEFEGEFKRINANITELRQIIEVEKTKIRPTLDIDSRLDRLFEQISAASANMENFENSIIRQLVAQVRVESAEELTIILHNGFRTTAKI